MSLNLSEIDKPRYTAIDLYRNLKEWRGGQTTIMIQCRYNKHVCVTAGMDLRIFIGHHLKYSLTGIGIPAVEPAADAAIIPLSSSRYNLGDLIDELQEIRAGRPIESAARTGP